MYLDMTDEEAIEINNKKKVLNVIKKLMDLEVLCVSEWYEMEELNKKKMSVKETIAYIDKIWHSKSKYPDLYGMMSFSSPDWYVKKTKELGLTMTTNWKTFVEEKIGNLEEWIKLNKPLAK